LILRILFSSLSRTRKMSAQTRLFLIVGLIAVAVGGCGGDSGTTAPPLTKAQLAARKTFIAKADEFCERARVKGERKGVWVFRAKARYYERKGSLDEFKSSIKAQEISIVLAPSMLRRVGEIRELGIPPRDRRQVEKVLEAIKEAATFARENPSRVLEEDLFARPRDLARAYGIDPCAVLYVPDGVFQKVSASANPGARLTPRSSK
jgi:hypothetical protein